MATQINNNNYIYIDILYYDNYLFKHKQSKNIYKFKKKKVTYKILEKYTAVQKRVIEHKSMYFFFEFIEKMIEVNI